MIDPNPVYTCILLPVPLDPDVEQAVIAMAAAHATTPREVVNRVLRTALIAGEAGIDQPEGEPVDDTKAPTKGVIEQPEGE